MTAIAAVTDGKTVWMGGDSAGATGWDIEDRADPRVFINGEYIFGFTTSFRMGQLLLCAFDAPPLPDDSCVSQLFNWMVTDFVDALRDCLKAGGFAEKDKERESGGTFLVGAWGRIFKIESDYQVGEVRDNFTAIGCGAPYAKGAMFACPEVSAPERIRIGLEAAAKFSNGVRGPFTILHLDTPED